MIEIEGIEAPVVNADDEVKALGTSSKTEGAAAPEQPEAPSAPTAAQPEAESSSDKLDLSPKGMLERVSKKRRMRRVFTELINSRLTEQTSDSILQAAVSLNQEIKARVDSGELSEEALQELSDYYDSSLQKACDIFNKFVQNKLSPVQTAEIVKEKMQKDGRGWAAKLFFDEFQMSPPRKYSEFQADDAKVTALKKILKLTPAAS